MSTAAVHEALSAFIRSQTPAVMVLTGKWGRGKTFLWQAFLRAPENREVLESKTYSYISLFGVETLAELRSALVMNVADPTDGMTAAKGARAALRRAGAWLARTRLVSWAKRWFRWKETLPDIVSSVVKQVDIGGLIRAALLRSVHGYLVCIDDIERRGEHLRLRDVLGYIASLRDERRCSVLLILNDDGLTDADSQEFALLREKVFDHEVRYEPTPEDNVELVFPSGATEWTTVRTNCVQLGIENIRVLQRVRRAYELFAEALREDVESFREWLAHSIPLLVLAHYSKEDRHPNLAFVLGSGLGRAVRRASGDQRPEDREDWSAFLAEYGYEQVAELDEVVAHYLRTGLIKVQELRERVAAARASEQQRAAEQRFSAAWDVFHGSFESNEDELVEALASALRVNLRWTSPGNVSATTMLLRELGHAAEADVLVREYVDELRSVSPEQLDLREYAFADTMRDEKLKRAMTDAFAKTVDAVPFPDAVGRLNEGARWTKAESDSLATATVEEIVTLLHAKRGPELRAAVRSLLQYRAPDRGDFNVVGRRTVEALQRIEAESELNRQRVRVYYPLPVFPPLPSTSGETDKD